MQLPADQVHVDSRRNPTLLRTAFAFSVLDKPTFAGLSDEHAAAPGRGKTGQKNPQARRYDESLELSDGGM